jgi:alpha-beta hydrolase superfamily lysophospholipase
MPAREEPVFFDSGGRRLFQVRHVPDGPVRGALVVCHPFGEEKKSAHRHFVELCRLLAGSGVASIRFDFTGCGDSDGGLRDATVERWTEDTRNALDACEGLAPGAPRFLLGLRLGAAVAALAVRDRPDVRGLALWQPIVDAKRAFAADLRRTLIKQMMTDGASKTTREALLAQLERGEGEIDLDGFPFTGALYREIAAIDLCVQAEPPCPCGLPCSSLRA